MGKAKPWTHSFCHESVTWRLRLIRLFPSRPGNSCLPRRGAVGQEVSMSIRSIVGWPCISMWQGHRVLPTNKNGEFFSLIERESIRMVFYSSTRRKTGVNRLIVRIWWSDWEPLLKRHWNRSLLVFRQRFPRRPRSEDFKKKNDRVRENVSDRLQVWTSKYYVRRIWVVCKKERTKSSQWAHPFPIRLERKSFLRS